MRNNGIPGIWIGEKYRLESLAFQFTNNGDQVPFHWLLDVTNGHCVYLDGVGFGTHNCNDEKYFICENIISVKIPVEDTTAASTTSASAAHNVVKTTFLCVDFS